MVSSLDYNAPWPIYALAWSNCSPSYHPTSSSSGASISRNPSLQSNHSDSNSNSRYLPPSSPGTGLSGGGPGPPRRSDQIHPSSPSNSQSNSNSTFTTASGLPTGSRIAIGSFLEEYSNRIQVIGPRSYSNNKGGKSFELALLADASHPYPATKLAFQPSSLFDSTSTGGASGLNHSNSTSSNSSSGGRSYVSPTTKFAKRSSWGVGGNQNQSSPNNVNININPSNNHHQELELDYYPDRELLASTADCLRIWEIHRQDSADGEKDSTAAGNTAAAANRNSYVGKAKNDGLPFALREKSVLAHSKSSASPPAPLTSFSWNAPSPNLIVTASIDTTCTIWDLPTRTALTQLIAHDREVYDVDWCPGSADVFASVGADGSVRVFDLRSLEHSTIIYEMASTQTSSSSGAEYAGQSSSTASGGLAIPLLKISFNPWDANYLATFHLESQAIQILDVRAPGSPILELKGHSGAVNAVSWGPPGNSTNLSNLWGSGHSSGPSKGMVATGGDDNQCLVYDLATSTLRSASAQGRRSRNGNTPNPNQSSNSTNPSPAPSSNYSNTTSPNPNSISASRIGVENPILATTLPDMVNNVAWLRLNPNSIHHSSNHHHQNSNSSTGSNPASASASASSAYGDRRDSRERISVVQEWDEYTGNGSGNANGNLAKDVDRDWLAMVSGNLVRTMRV